jgi:hypothetical protein
LEGEAQDRMMKRAAEIEKQQMGEHLAAQGAAMLNLGSAVADAASAVAKPRVHEIERDERGNLISTRSRIADDE